MALLFADNFQVYGTDHGAMLDGAYAQVGDSIGGTTNVAVVNDPDPLIGSAGKAFRINYDSAISGLFRHVFKQGGQTDFGVGIRLWMAQLPGVSTKAPGISFRDTANACQVQMIVNTDGTLSFYRASAVTSGGAGMSGTSLGTLIATSTIPVVTANAWNHIEIKLSIHDTTGTIDVQVNDVPVAGLSGLTGLDTKGTANATVTQVVVGGTASSGDNSELVYFKDYWEWNTSGNAPTGFIGAKNVYWLQPDGDSSLTWDVSTGSTGWDLIDESGPSETDYISADDTPPAASAFTLTNLPADIVTIYGVMSMARMWKTDSGDATVQIGLKGTAEADGDDRTITGSPTYWTDVFDVSPDTSVMWTPAEINNVLFTPDRTT